MGAKLITYECVADDHQPDHAHPDKLTIHDGHWAFCAFDARATGHKWVDIGGEQLEMLMAKHGITGRVAMHDAKAETATSR
jgi:hypothetical protein